MQTLSLKQQNCIAQEQYTKDHVRDNVYAECISFHAYMKLFTTTTKSQRGVCFHGNTVLFQESGLKECLWWYVHEHKMVKACDRKVVLNRVVFGKGFIYVEIWRFLFQKSLQLSDSCNKSTVNMLESWTALYKKRSINKKWGRIFSERFHTASVQPFHYSPDSGAWRLPT